MFNLLFKLRRLYGDQRGVTAIEYAVLAGAVAVGLAAVLGTDGAVFNNLTTAIGNAVDETVANGTPGS